MHFWFQKQNYPQKTWGVIFLENIGEKYHFFLQIRPPYGHFWKKSDFGVHKPLTRQGVKIGTFPRYAREKGAVKGLFFEFRCILIVVPGGTFSRYAREKDAVKGLFFEFWRILIVAQEGDS